MAAGDATYATRAEYEDYVGVAAGSTDADEVGRLLRAAERDVDRMVGPWSVEANGLKFGSPSGANEKRLTAGQRALLSRATCAQAEYREEMGPEFFVRAQYDSVSGPDFSTRGRLPRYGPKAEEELRGSGLRASAASYARAVV